MPTRRVTLAQWCAELDKMALEAPAIPSASAKIIAPVLREMIVSEVIGHTPPLAPLAESTQIERARLGFTPNDPLRRTGDYAESFGAAAVGPVAASGSADPRVVWFEKGTARMPARPAARIGLIETAPLAKKIIKGLVGRMLGKVPRF